MANAAPRWWMKPLDALSPEEWERLCDGCGRCCLVKLEDEDTGAYHFTNVACRLFNPQTCACGDYANRLAAVPDCVRLTPENAGTLGWLPSTCAYRLRAEDKPLAWWHPLVSGRRETVAEAGIAMRGRTVSEIKVDDADLEHHIIALPKPLPQKRRK